MVDSSGQTVAGRATQGAPDPSGGLLVAKFGGSSVADAGQILKVRAIVADDSRRRFVVVSAPGRRHDQDQKITDVLYLCHQLAEQRVSFNEAWDIITGRFNGLVSDLGLSDQLDLAADLDGARAKIEQHAQAGLGPDFAASRGEYFNARIVAAALDLKFVDAADLIVFDARGQLDSEQTYARAFQRLARSGPAVVPGFYGALPDGTIKTFSRGGSDVTGAILARAMNASAYENWTDVSGLLMADPRIIDSPREIAVITYRELRELSYMGASVLHEDAVFPVRQNDIPVHIRNTNQPEHPGTQIISNRAADTMGQVASGAISGIAGRKDFSAITIEKAMMNAEVGFGRRVLSVLEDYGISFEHMPSGIDTMTVVVASASLNGKRDDVIEELIYQTESDSVEIHDGIALIATVGRGMAQTPGTAARLFAALAETGINIRMMDQGSSELNIIVGVEEASFETAIRAIYGAFVGD